MAKLLFGAIVADARNKVGGVVFSRNIYGAYLKTKASPAEATSAAAAQSTASISASAKTWGSALTQEQRDAWIALAAATPVLDVFGNTQHLTGIATFVKVNRELKLIGQAQIKDPPANFTTMNIGAVTPTFTLGPPYLLKLTVTNTPADPYQLVVCASTMLTPGKKLPKANKIPFVQAFAKGATSPFDFTDFWNAKYVKLPLFGMIAVAAYAVNSTNGAAGPRAAALLPIT